MGIDLNLINVIDIEATCWQDKPPDGQESEIIEIGICTLEVATGNRLDRDSILVKPEHSTVSQFCTNLTTLTTEHLEMAGGFKEACKVLRKKYFSRDRVWASYGQYDLRQFQRQCQSFQVAYPFNQRHFNVKTWFAIANNLPSEVGMAQALEILNLPLEGTHHRGIDDAGNIARILANLLGFKN